MLVVPEEVLCLFYRLIPNYLIYFDDLINGIFLLHCNLYVPISALWPHGLQEFSRQKYWSGLPFLQAQRLKVTQTYCLNSFGGQKSEMGLTELRSRCQQGSGQRFLCSLFQLLEGACVPQLLAPSAVFKARNSITELCFHGHVFSWLWLSFLPLCFVRSLVMTLGPSQWSRNVSHPTSLT